MSEIITLNGNLTADPTLRHSRAGVPVASFTIASNRRRFDAQTGNWTDQRAVFHRVVCFKKLADHVAASLRRGATVSVTGEFTDDSFTPEGTDQPVRRIQLVASDVAVSLRFTTVTVSRPQHAEQINLDELTTDQPARQGSTAQHADESTAA
jgi:single-strand DNA-binding protein